MVRMKSESGANLFSAIRGRRERLWRQFQELRRVRLIVFVFVFELARDLKICDETVDAVAFGGCFRRDKRTVVDCERPSQTAIVGLYNLLFP